MTARGGDPNWPPEPLHVAVDVVAIALVTDGLQVLLVKRPYPPFDGAWALPGTFSRPDETLEDSPSRALLDKTGVRDVHLEQLATYDQPGRPGVPGRDPRGRVVSVAFLALLGPGAVRTVVADPAVAFFPVTGTPAPLAFDHDRMLRDALERLRAKTRYAPMAFALLPDEFTIPELQAAYEALLGEDLDERNFRRDLHNAGVIEPTGGTRSDGPGRPATLYRHRAGSFAVDAEERRLAERIARSGPRGPGDVPAGQ